MKRTFEEWMAEIDRIVRGRTGLSIRDLPDCAFAVWYENATSPKSAAGRAIRYAEGGEE